MAPLTPYFVWSSNWTSSLRRSASTAFLVLDHPFADVNLLRYRADGNLRVTAGFTTLCAAWCRPQYPPLRASRPPRRSAARGRRPCERGSPLSPQAFSGPRPRPLPPARLPRRPLSGPPKPRRLPAPARRLPPRDGSAPLHAPG